MPKTRWELFQPTPLVYKNREAQVCSSNKEVPCKDTLGITGGGTGGEEPAPSPNRCCNKAPPQKALGDHSVSRDASKQCLWLFMSVFSMTKLCDFAGRVLPGQLPSVPSPSICFFRQLAAHGFGLWCLRFTSRQLFSFHFIANWQIPLSFLLRYLRWKIWLVHLSPGARSCSHLLESEWLCCPGIRCLYLVY